MIAPRTARVLRSILCPQIAVRQVIRRLRIGSLDFRMAMQSGGDSKLCPWGLTNCGVLFPAIWTRQLWVYHRFRRPQYNTYIGM